LASSGVIGVGCLAFAEKLIPVMPSYALLLFLGMTVVSDAQALLPVAAATTAGSVAGSLCWYGFGRALGSQRIERLVARFGGYLLFGPERYGRLTGAYRRNHFWVTLVGQTIPAVRVYLALPAGVLRLEPRLFLVATSLGTFLWNVPFLSLGYGLRWSDHDPAVTGLVVIAGVVATELIIAYVMRVRARGARKREPGRCACVRSVSCIVPRGGYFSPQTRTRDHGQSHARDGRARQGRRGVQAARIHL
jgi:membrane protein DedA with SNARE-associated domain